MISWFAEIDIRETFFPSKCYQSDGMNLLGSTQVSIDVKSTIVINGGIKVKKKKKKKKRV